MKKIAFIAGAIISAEGQIFINGELLPSIGKKKEGYKVQVTLSANVSNDILEGNEGDILEFTQDELVMLYESLPVEKTDNKARIKELKKQIEKLVIAGKYDELAPLGEELKALEESKPTKVKEVIEATEEQKAQIEAYEAKIAEIDAMKAQINEIKEAIILSIESLPALREGIESFTKRYGAKGDGNTAPKNIIGQDVRKMYAELIAEGLKHSEAVNRCAEYFGCTPTTVNRKVLYQQSPISRNDVQYTPVINAHFPKFWKDSNGVVRSGAPFIEDNVVLTQREVYWKNPETDSEGNLLA